MVRNPIKKAAPEEIPQEEPKNEESPQVQVLEREISLSLINDKLNYLTGVIHKIAQACEVETD